MGRVGRRTNGNNNAGLLFALLLPTEHEPKTKAKREKKIRKKVSADSSQRHAMLLLLSAQPPSVVLYANIVYAY